MVCETFTPTKTYVLNMMYFTVHTYYTVQYCKIRIFTVNVSYCTLYSMSTVSPWSNISNLSGNVLPASLIVQQCNRMWLCFFGCRHSRVLSFFPSRCNRLPYPLTRRRGGGILSYGRRGGGGGPNSDAENIRSGTLCIKYKCTLL